MECSKCGAEIGKLRVCTVCGTSVEDSEWVGVGGTELHAEYDVFISYSSKNRNIADAICANFEQFGIRCWYAPRDIRPGETWAAAINGAIKCVKLFVLVFSEESNHSDQVLNEVELASKAGKTIIPFRITEAEMEPGLEYYLSRVHWLDALTTPMERNIIRLREYVKSILDLHVAAPNEEVAVTKEKPKSKLPLILISSFAVAGVAAFLITGAVKAESLEKKGKELYFSMYQSDENNAASRESLVLAVSKGKEDAYYYLGKLDERSFDYESAKKNYENGISEGSDLARLGLGALYLDGNGVKVDVVKASELFKEALENGCLEANYYMGYLAKNGMGGEEFDGKKGHRIF